MQLNVGTRLRSASCSTEVIVVRSDGGDFDLRCGGVPMTDLTGDGSMLPLDSAYSDGTALGKRYVDRGGRLELLCTKGGDGSLSLEDERLTVKAAKPLPSSD